MYNVRENAQTACEHLTKRQLVVARLLFGNRETLYVRLTYSPKQSLFEVFDIRGVARYRTMSITFDNGYFWVATVLAGSAG